jgi:hypothetical protein
VKTVLNYFATLPAASDLSYEGCELNDATFVHIVKEHAIRRFRPIYVDLDVFNARATRRLCSGAQDGENAMGTVDSKRAAELILRRNGSAVRTMLS